MNSELKARLGRLGPVLDELPPQSFSGKLVTLVLRIQYPWDKAITVANRLRTAGLTLDQAHKLITRLAKDRIASCEIAEGANIPLLVADLASMNVAVTSPRPKSLSGHGKAGVDRGGVTRVRPVS